MKGFFGYDGRKGGAVRDGGRWRRVQKSEREMASPRLALSSEAGELSPTQLTTHVIVTFALLPPGVAVIESLRSCDCCPLIYAYHKNNYYVLRMNTTYP